MTTHAKLGLLLSLMSTWAFVGCLGAPEDDETLGDAAQLLSDQEVADACAQKPHKQAVCHIPPGNPANAHTICISENAVDKHLALHGDYLGPCEPGDGEGGGDSTGEGGAGQGGGDPGTGGQGGEATFECSPSFPACGKNGECAEGSYCEGGCCVPYTL